MYKMLQHFSADVSFIHNAFSFKTEYYFGKTYCIRFQNLLRCEALFFPNMEVFLVMNIDWGLKAAFMLMALCWSYADKAQ